jgi:hypothetical protein
MKYRKIISILLNFSRKSEMKKNLLSKYGCKNISFDDFYEYIGQCYIKFDEKYSNKLKNNLDNIIKVQDKLICDKIIYDRIRGGEEIFDINEINCKEYLNFINSIERFLKKYNRILSILLGILMGLLPTIIKLFI